MDDPASKSMVLFHPDLRTADTVGPLSTDRPLDRATGLLAGSDGTTLYLAVQSTDGAAVARIARLTGSTLALKQLPRSTITGMWLLPDARTLTVAEVTDLPSGARQGSLRLLPADLSDDGTAVSACSGGITGFTSLGRRGRAYLGCVTDTVVEIDVTLGLLVRAVGVSDVGSSSRAGCGTSDVASSPNGTIIYVLCRNWGTLLYLDRVTLSALTAVDVGVDASTIALTPNGRRAVVTRPRSGEMVVIDLRRRSVYSRIAIPDVQRAVIGSDGRDAYVIAGEGGPQPVRVLRVNLETGARLGERVAAPSASLLSLWPTTRTPRMWWASRPALQPAEP